jgi:hypothetical protein
MNIEVQKYIVYIVKYIEVQNLRIYKYKYMYSIQIQELNIFFTISASYGVHFCSSEDSLVVRNILSFIYKFCLSLWNHLVIPSFVSF